jgi:hypothetical protein
MREINAAWEVLRNPAARAAYDEQLTAASRPPPRHPATPRRTVRPPSFADHLVDPRVESGPPRHRSGWRWAPVVVIVVVFVSVLVATAYAAHHHDGSGGSGGSGGVQVQTDNYPVGSCVAVTPGPVATVVPCDQPHTGTVAATTDYPRPCPSGTSEVALVEQQISLCLTP